MPLVIPATVLTGDYQQFGGGSLYETGYLVVVNGPIDLELFYGSATGQAKSVVFPAIAAGQYYFSQGTRNLIVRLAARAANGSVTSPAQTVQGSFTEPGIPSLVPVAGGVTLDVATSAPQLVSLQPGAQATTANVYADLSPEVTFTISGGGTWVLDYSAYLDSGTAGGTGSAILGLNVNGSIVDSADSETFNPSAVYRGTLRGVYSAEIAGGTVVKLQWHTNSGSPHMSGKNFALLGYLIGP